MATARPWTTAHLDMNIIKHDYTVGVNQMGFGFLKSVYEMCMAIELQGTE